MVEILEMGGWLMLPIMVCSILVLGICMERAWTLQRDRIVPSESVDQAIDLIDNPDEKKNAGVIEVKLSRVDTICRFAKLSARRGVDDQRNRGYCKSSSPRLRALFDVVRHYGLCKPFVRVTRHRVWYD